MLGVSVILDIEELPVNYRNVLLDQILLVAMGTNQVETAPGEGYVTTLMVFVTASKASWGTCASDRTP